MKAIVEKLTGPTTSMLLHLLIIFAAYKFIRFVTDTPDKKIEVVVVDPETVDLEEFEQELEQLEQVDEVVDSNMMTEAPMENDAPEVEDMAEESMEDLSDLAIMDVASPVVLKNVFAGRSKVGRMSNLNRYGGNKATEAAVVKALEWLKDNQIKEGPAKGTWGKANQPALAALALLTYLAHGETPASERYGETVENAIQYLVKKQDPKTGMWKGTSHDYGHGVATYAIAEAYAMTKIPSLRASMEKGVAVIVDGIGTKELQKKGSIVPVKGVDVGGKTTGGFWNYHYDNKGGRWDTSYAGWQAQALKAAKLAGSSNPKLAQTLELAKNGFKSMQGDNGAFGYGAPGGNNGSMTGVGTLCLQLLGEGKSPEAKSGLDNLKDTTFIYPEVGGEGDKGHGKSKIPGVKSPLYFVYYTSQAKFHAGGNTWKSWNKKFAPELVKHQNPDGSWSSTEHGGNEPAYTTTLGALTLMVYYRNLPTFKETATRSTAPPPPPPEADDIKLEII